MIPWLIGLFVLFLCWGSFLNVVGYRIIRGYSLAGRSFCPHCRHGLAWYDLVPVISWLALWGRCRNCRNRISILYPFIELLTATVLSLMILVIDQQYWVGYGIFITALLVTIRTDFERMEISRYMTLALIPVAWLLSYFGYLPITFYQSIIGTIFGYGLLWLIASLYHLLRQTEGMGEGDMDLLGMIGAFTGIPGAWITLLLGSLFGTIVHLFMMLITKRSFYKAIAFGPWLAAGALVYIFFDKQILALIEHYSLLIF